MAKADEFAAAIGDVLAEYTEEVAAAVEDAVTVTAKETVKVVRREAQSVLGGSGAYAKSWAQKKAPAKLKTMRFERVVYSKPPYYRLAHLLEHGHAKVNGGRVAGRPHISAAEEYAIKRLDQLTRRGIEEA